MPDSDPTSNLPAQIANAVTGIPQALVPETMHKDLRRLALEDGIPLTQITERLLREFLVKKGYTQHAAK